jgi:hypothetical protein
MANAYNDSWLDLKYGLDDGKEDPLTTHFLNFKAVEYANKQSVRENPASDWSNSDTFADITLPMSRNMNTNNSINYSLGQTEAQGGILDPTTGGFWEQIMTGFGITTWFKDLAGSFGSGWEGQRPMDERDSIFRGANFRQHNYEWVLINKWAGQGAQISGICNAFQSLAYPFMADDQYYSRVIHPPVWYFNEFQQKYNPASAKWEKVGRKVDGHGIEDDNAKTQVSSWDNWPLPSVLTKVNIQSSGAAGGMYVGQDGHPAVTKLSVTFQELEPAINTGSRIHSRSQVRGGEYTNPQ